MKPLYAYFGGKSVVAPLIWEVLGNPAHYIEPCYGGGAVHLARPHPPGLETVNDLDCFVVNFLRAAQQNPDGVAQWATWPVSEADLHARHLWLVQQDDWHARMTTDPLYYDVQIAGWWVWGCCAWIGSGWCHGVTKKQRPHLGHSGMGVHRKGPDLHRYGLGVQGKDVQIQEAIAALAARFARVRICCGDWARVCTPVVLNALRQQSLGIFLDPPYSLARRDTDLYRRETDPAAACAAWARAHASRPNTRIVLAGYVGEHDMPGWTVHTWKANGGLGNQGTGRGKANARLECLWFSPQCQVQQLGLFG